MHLDIEDLAITPVNEAKMSSHAVSVEEVFDVVGSPDREDFRNPSTTPGVAPYVVVGPTRGGRILTVPVDETDTPGLFYPRTAYDSGSRQLAMYRRRRGRG